MKEISDSKDIDVLWVGRLIKHQKGLDLLMEVIKKVCLRKSGINCVVVGEGEEGERYLKKEIVEKGMEKNIRIMNGTTNIVPFYNRAKICINTSRWEGFGLVVTEAMSNGVPVVSFKTNGPSEIIRNNIDGYLVDCFDTDIFAEKIIFLLNQSFIREDFSKQAKIRSEDFSIGTICTKWKSFIDK